MASTDSSYDGFGDSLSSDADNRLCCFPRTSYHDLTARNIYIEVRRTLDALRPDITFAPATPFPEGMAAIGHRIASGSRTIMMDDAWEFTDKRGYLVRAMKKLIHGNVDGVFIPAPSHASYYESLGFPRQRIAYGVDVVDNDYFARLADAARAQGLHWRSVLSLPPEYFLFVGRFLPRKGLDTLIDAYRRYRDESRAPWDLVLVGSGPYANAVEELSRRVRGVHFTGPRFGDELARMYGLASVLVVPSTSDPWGLVVNEGLACGLPLIASTGTGAAPTLVIQDENGWCFPPGDATGLTRLLHAASSCSSEVLDRMGKKSRNVIASWSLDRFADGVLEAAQFPRAAPSGLLSRVAALSWKGRVDIR